MNKDFSEVMSERTDKQLVDIVSIKRDEYQVEAISAAEKEIARRQIKTETFYTADQIHSIKNAPSVNNGELTFEWHHKLLTLLLPAAVIVLVTVLFTYLKFGENPVLRLFGFPAIIGVHYFIHHWLKDNGYTTMAKDFLKWVTYTLYIYIGLVLIIGLIIYFFFM